jgi:hypothetical protein
MKIEEILNYQQDQELLRRIGDAFLPNGELKFPVDFGGLLPDTEPMDDQTADAVSDEISAASVDQRPKPMRQSPGSGGVDSPRRVLGVPS